MKTKKFEKKLALNKKTVANLNKEDMKKLKSGQRSRSIDHPPNCPTN